MKIIRWDQKTSSGDTIEALLDLARWHLGACSPSKQHAEIGSLVENRDLSGLCHYELAYLDDQSPADVYHLRQVLAFFSKNKGFDIGVDTRMVAWEKAVAAEKLCRETNDIFRMYHRGGFFFPRDVEAVLYRAQCKIADILGDVPALSQLNMRFGPGATTQVIKREASVRRKLAQRFACSGELEPILGEVLAEFPGWSGVNPSGDLDSCAVDIHVARTDFVPKSAKTDRTICVEPVLNSMLQLGLGTYMAKRLRIEGVTISDQTPNQRMAREGSLTGALATLDLSSASDTVASGLVEDLLPLDWWLLLCRARSGCATGPDGPYRLEKFSSMGNGFTFPLETLVFYALSWACLNILGLDTKRLRVYGDDIVIHTDAVALLSKTLHSCGFILNKSKSFSSGPFRESCGKDYYLGTDVRPCYIKDVLTGQTAFTLHNYYIERGLTDPARIVLDWLDESLVLWGPRGYGDGHLVGDWNPNPHNRKYGWSGYTFETYTYKSRKGFYRLGADYVFPSYSIYVKDFEEEVLPVDASKMCDGLTNAQLLAARGRVRIGAFRPDLNSSVYEKKDGRVSLVDILPGVDGYKRIKVYTLSPI